MLSSLCRDFPVEYWLIGWSSSSTTILQIPFNSHSFERRTKSEHYFQNLFLWRKDAQGQLDVAQRFISFHSYVSPKQNQLKPAKQDKMHYFDFSSNWILGFSVPGAVQKYNLGKFCNVWINEKKIKLRNGKADQHYIVNLSSFLSFMLSHPARIS